MKASELIIECPVCGCVAHWGRCWSGGEVPRIYMGWDCVGCESFTIPVNAQRVPAQSYWLTRYLDPTFDKVLV